MKTIDELGISPAPWKSTVGKVHLNQVWDNSNWQIQSGGYTESVSDARLIAAAPVLYECLRMAYLHMIGEYDYNGCEAKRFKDALAKASGEEVK